MLIVTLPDGKKLEFTGPVTAMQVAERISSGLAKAALAARLNGQLGDMFRLIDRDATIEIITAKSDPDTARELVRHSCAHVMAEAICRLYPQARLVYGPTVDSGFFYDIDLDRPVTPDDFGTIEAEMRKIVNEDRPFVRYEMTLAQAMAKLEKEGNRYKIDNAKRAKGDTISFYVTGSPEKADFEDLCMGPHICRTGQIGDFKIMSVAGAYFHGDAKEKMLQRIYGTAFADKKELKQYLNMLEEAKKRDHRAIGRQMDLFSFQEEGPGFPFLHPNGMIIWNEMMKYWAELHDRAGYKQVRTPIILNQQLWHQSGHWDHYRQNMYFTKIDDQDYAIKPMNCPGGCLIYKSRPHSYREFPIRMAELGMVHRHEASGVLHGLMRVRQFVQDDAHIFCTPDQIEAEVVGVMHLIAEAYMVFGLTDCAMELSTRPEKSIGSDEMWERATSALETALQSQGVQYKVNRGDGAFYGPKIDFHIRDCLGRSWQTGTIQLDFSMPQRFDLNYVDRDNTEKRPAMIHRVVYGGIERFFGILIEHYGGNFPLWLAPEQARIMPISEKTNDFAYKVYDRLKAAGLRCTIDAADDKVNAKIKRGHEMKLPYMLVVGPSEADSDTVTVRVRGAQQQLQMKVDEFVARCTHDNVSRKLELFIKSDDAKDSE